MGEIGQIPNHQVRVDNWPLFFLQRLNHFYRKKSHCDLTLMFSTVDTVKSIKVHRLVLHACTDYFDSLDVMKDSEHGEFLQLSDEMHPDVVIPIISFMYTGKLEFPVTLQPRLYEAATKLRMTILTKLLTIQPKKGSKKTKDSLQEMSILDANINTSVETNQDSQDMSSSEISSVMKSTEPPKAIDTPVPISSSVSNSSALQKKIMKPEITNTQQPDAVLNKSPTPSKIVNITKNIGLKVTTHTSKPKVIGASLPPPLPGRKLPVWKRKVPFTGSQNSNNVESSLKSTDAPKPTRFEWDEDLQDPTVPRPVEDAPKILSHDRSVKIGHPIILDSDPSKRDLSIDSSKRSSDDSFCESPPYKRSRSDLQDMKEYGKQQQLRNEIICSEDIDDTMDTDDLYGTCDDDPDELSNFSQPNVNTSTPKPILKTVSKPEPPLSSKRVRFSLEGKENNQQQSQTSSDFTALKQSETTPTKSKIVLPVDVNQLQSYKHNVKIVSEVLKKFPNLAKQENIKLKVVSKSPAAVPPTVQKAVEGGSKAGASTVSYIFLTNKGSIDPIKLESNEKDNKVFDVENKFGPWICNVCNEAEPLEFQSYYYYRRHLVEVHELKIDARICEYCGLKSSKRNHLLYHLYTKHGINPPPNVSFPKCNECDYVALSDALFFKHKASHDPSGSHYCYSCNVVFKSYSAIQLHLNSDWHRRRINGDSGVLSVYPCPFCDSRFKSSNDLKDHMETNHHSQTGATNMENKQLYRCPYCETLYEDADNLGKHVISIHWGQNEINKEDGAKADSCQPQSGQQVLYQTERGPEVENTESVEGRKNQASADLESFSNVASGIATSLNLADNEQTVVYYEQKTDGQDIGREATVIAEGDGKEYSIAETVQDVHNNQSQSSNEGMEIVEVENEDSNSRASNTEEGNPKSFSDHDYSEPQIDETYRQVIPVHSVPGPITGGSVIQQIVPDQGVVFAGQDNVVFQSPCVSLPQRVLLTSGKVVLPDVTGEQNVILSQVLPQTQIILSGPIIQQPGGIIDDGNNAIMFTNTEPAQMDNIQTVHYQTQEAQNVECGGSQNVEQVEEESETLEDKHIDEKDRDHKNEPENQENESKKSDHDVNTVSEELKTTSRVETSKIVDDWDEMNENTQNVESRGDGPSRPDFF